MRLVHSVVVTPGQCGLYETANDLISAERELGVDVIVVDPMQDKKVRPDCDVIVDHSGLSDDMWKSGTPVIHVRHGRPHSTFLIQEQGGRKVFSFLRSGRNRYARVVTFWQQHVPYLKLLFDRKDIDCLPPPVNLKRWVPDGPSHDFKGNRGVFNLLCTDIFRQDEDPFHVLTACGLLPKEFKIHVAGLKGGINLATNTLITSIGENRGSMFDWIKNLDYLYRAVDLVISPHKIATRAIRESMACGTPVIADLRNEHATFTADAHDATAFAEGITSAMSTCRRGPTNARTWAEDHFDSENTAIGFLKVAEEVISSRTEPCTI